MALFAVTSLADEGLPVACEGDVDGARRCSAAPRMRRAYISDWLGALICSVRVLARRHVPTCLTSDTGDGGFRIRPHFNNKKPAVVDGARGPVWKSTSELGSHESLR